MRRRALLKQTGGLATLSLLAGCSSSTESDDESPSPGQVVVRNDHTIPHIITIRIQDGPTGPLGEPITSTGQVALDPGEERTYPEWLAVGDSGVVAGEYDIEVQLDDGEPDNFQFDPKPVNDPPMYVTVDVEPGGGLGWNVTAIHSD
ncbi:hypothetical protein [Halorubrum sp. FL23]|uniref:hypothetical protein n=1 Tax=Halorubrum sp. FL23 TaxID=3458704 RepID=UPI0040337A9E